VTVRSVLFPVFNLGQAVLFASFLLIIVLIAASADVLLAIYMGVGAYAGIVIYALLFGLAPDQADIQEDEIGPISAFLATEPFVFPIKERIWAPAKSRSQWFKSDWISIDETEDGKLVLKGRRRDLKIILLEIRQRKVDSKTKLL
jgi:hypothetical protein